MTLASNPLGILQCLEKEGPPRAVAVVDDWSMPYLIAPRTYFHNLVSHLKWIGGRKVVPWSVIQKCALCRRIAEERAQTVDDARQQAMGDVVEQPCRQPSAADPGAEDNGSDSPPVTSWPAQRPNDNPQPTTNVDNLPSWEHNTIAMQLGEWKDSLTTCRMICRAAADRCWPNIAGELINRDEIRPDHWGDFLRIFTRVSGKTALYQQDQEVVLTRTDGTQLHGTISGICNGPVRLIHLVRLDKIVLGGVVTLPSGLCVFLAFGREHLVSAADHHLQPMNNSHRMTAKQAQMGLGFHVALGIITEAVPTNFTRGRRPRAALLSRSESRHGTPTVPTMDKRVRRPRVTLTPPPRDRIPKPGTEDWHGANPSPVGSSGPTYPRPRRTKSPTIVASPIPTNSGRRSATTHGQLRVLPTQQGHTTHGTPVDTTERMARLHAEAQQGDRDPLQGFNFRQQMSSNGEPVAPSAVRHLLRNKLRSTTKMPPPSTPLQSGAPWAVHAAYNVSRSDLGLVIKSVMDTRITGQKYVSLISKAFSWMYTTDPAVLLRNFKHQDVGQLVDQGLTAPRKYMVEGPLEDPQPTLFDTERMATWGEAIRSIATRAVKYVGRRKLWKRLTAVPLVWDNIYAYNSEPYARLTELDKMVSHGAVSHEHVTYDSKEFVQGSHDVYRETMRFYTEAPTTVREAKAMLAEYAELVQRLLHMMHVAQGEARTMALAATYPKEFVKLIERIGSPRQVVSIGWVLRAYSRYNLELLRVVHDWILPRLEDMLQLQQQATGTTAPDVPGDGGPSSSDDTSQSSADTSPSNHGHDQQSNDDAADKRGGGGGPGDDPPDDPSGNDTTTSTTPFKEAINSDSHYFNLSVFDAAENAIG